MPADLAAADDLADRERAAWDKLDRARRFGYEGQLLNGYLDAYLAARRAALDAGYQVALVSKEAVEALEAVRRGVFDAPDSIEHARAKACLLLARDLAPPLKETTE